MAKQWKDMSYWERAKERARQGALLLRQAGAGIVETTVANSAEEGKGYRPAIVDTVAAPITVVAAIVNRNQKSMREQGVPFDGSNVTEQNLNETWRGMQRARERTNAFGNLRNPKNTAETAARIGGGLLIPAPKGSQVAKVLSKGGRPGRATVAGARKATEAVKRVAAKAPAPVRTAGRIVGKTGKVAAEIAMPLRQTKVKTAAMIGVPLTGAVDVISDVVDPEYKGVLGIEHEAPKDDIDTLLDEIAAPEPQDEIDAILDGPVEQKDIDQAEQDEQELGWQEAIGTVAAIGVGFLAASHARKLLQTRVLNAPEEAASFTGKQFRRSRGGIVERAQTKFVQQDQPLRNAADEFLSPQQAAEYKHNADLINNVSIGARAAHFMRTGKMPGTNMRTVRLAPQAEAYAKELTLDEQRVVSDALLAQSALDDIARTGTQAALKFDRNGNPVTPATLRSMVAAARANPKFVKHMDAVTRAYQDLLKFRVARGMLTPEAARELATKRPNYVRFARDLETEGKKADPTPFNANEHRAAPGFSRADEDAGGVQGTSGVGNPFNLLLEDWASEIRRAEINDLRKFWLEEMDRVGVINNGKRLVHRLPNGVAPKTEEGIHRVFVNGQNVVYKVNDDVLSSALEFSPRATWQGLEMMRQIAQNTVTGPLGTLVNGFGFFKSPIYDTTMGMLLKPKDVHLGLMNELLSKKGMSIGRLDPTALVTSFTGAARYAWDDLRGAMAQNLSDQLIREHSWLRSIIGDQNVTALRDTLQAAYENSVKSIMDENGISSLTMHGTPDPSEVMTGLHNITPRFSSDMAEQLAKDTMAARAKGEVGPLQSLLARDGAGFAKLRSGTIARTYGSLLEAMHNGFRYSVVAANKSRNPNIKRLASQARRISVDSAQHGGSDAFNKTAGSFMYANLTIQSLHAVGRRMITNPAQFAANLGSITLPLLAMHYIATASDPIAKEQHAGKTAAQKAAAVTTFGGAEIPVDPVLRLMLHPLMVLMDHVTGAHDGNWNGDALKAMTTWLEGGYDEDAYAEDAWETFWQDVKANNPFTPEAFPGMTGAMASMGIDPGMTRIADTAMPVRTQTLTGFDADKKQPDDITSAYMGNIITSLAGSFGQHTLNMVNDSWRAFGATNEVEQAMEAGLSRYRDTMAKGAAVARPILFDNYEQIKGVSDTNWQIVHDKEKGIEQALKLYNSDVRAGSEMSSLSHRDAMPLATDAPQMRPEVTGTQNAAIAASASYLNKQLAKLNARLAGLSKQSEAIRAGYVTRQEVKNVKINELTEERKYYTFLKRQMIADTERAIGQNIGDPDFSFEDYDPEKYTAPFAAPQ